MTLSIYWLIAGAGFLALEAFGASGIGFFFAGIAALLTGLSVELALISPDAVIMQCAVFLILTSLSAALLWKRLKAWRTNPKNAGSYSNMIGDDAMVVGTLVKGQTGMVRWSGTDMRAVIDASSSAELLSDGARVTITAVNGNVVSITLNA